MNNKSLFGKEEQVRTKSGQFDEQEWKATHTENEEEEEDKQAKEQRKKEKCFKGEGDEEGKRKLTI